MSSVVCSDCGHQRGSGNDECPVHGGITCKRFAVDTLRAQLASAISRAERAERELKALDLLCGLVSEEDGTIVFRVLEGGQRHCQARIVPARGDTAGRAALELAVRFGLLGRERSKP